MRLMGSFQTITPHGVSGVTTSSISGSLTSTGATESDGDTPSRVLRRRSPDDLRRGGGQRAKITGRAGTVEGQAEAEGGHPHRGRPGHVQPYQEGGDAVEVLDVADP